MNDKAGAKKISERLREDAQKRRKLLYRKRILARKGKSIRTPKAKGGLVKKK